MQEGLQFNSSTVLFFITGCLAQKCEEKSTPYMCVELKCPHACTDSRRANQPVQCSPQAIKDPI